MITNILGAVMKYLYNLVNNYGLAIILFTFFSKLILFPISLLVQKNSIKLVSLKSKINRIKIEYFCDEDKITELESDLYKKEHYNPFLSVIPLIIQIILLFSMIKIVNNPITYITNIDKNTRDQLLKEVSNAKYPELEIIKKAKNNKINNDEIKKLNLSFINYDLSSIANETNNYVFPFLAALSSFLYCVIQNKINVLQREQSKKYNTIMLIISVSLSLYLGLYVPAGVALYWTVGNLLAILTLVLQNVLIDPKKYIDYEELKETNDELMKLSSEDRSKEIIKKEKNDYKKFFSIDNKHLVFYAENSSYYKYFKGIIEYLLEHTNIVIHYITSDYNDTIFKMNIKNFKAYYIGEKKLISLMMRMDSDVVVMTMPDLNKYHIKRSYVRKDIEYIYMQHGLNSINLSMRKGALDYFDTIFVTGIYPKKDIIKENKKYNLKRKVVEVGYPLLDDMIKNYKKKNNNSIIIAPSWQKDNIMDSCVEDIINVLSKKHKVILRAHPHYIKHNKNKYEYLKNKYNDNKNVIIQDDYSTNNNILDSKLLITDWSGIGYEYAYTTKKPVVFIDTPMKIINPDYKEINSNPYDIWVRDIVGKSVKLNEIKKLDIIIDDILKNKKEYEKNINKFIKESIYNISNSGEIGAKYLINTIQEKIERRKND